MICLNVQWRCVQPEDVEYGHTNRLNIQIKIICPKEPMRAFNAKLILLA